MAAVLVPGSFVASQELVPNGSFESHSGCPFAPASIAHIDSWFVPTFHTGSPDYFHTCATSANVSVPTNFIGSEYPSEGDGYVGIVLKHADINYREYIQVKLLEPMASGSTYTISFKYSLADHSIYETDALGIYFGSDTVQGPEGPDVLTFTPQITMTGMLGNKDGWTEINRTYMATGGEQFMVFGNFLNDAMTTLNYLGAFDFYGSYLYLDEISVVPEGHVSIDDVLPPGSCSWTILNEVLTISSSQRIDELNISDMSGKLIYSARPGSNRVEIAQPANGIYIISISTPSGEIRLRAMSVQ